MTIGILAIQGSVVEHKRMLEKLDIEVIEVRQTVDLKNLDGIILPGGESTTQSKLLKRFGLFNELKKRIEGGLPTWGTCAGAILLAKQVEGKNPPPTFEVMDVQADRNAYGGQLDSFKSSLQMGDKKITGVFIRAPKLQAKTGGEIIIKHDNEAVMIRQNHMLVTAFHPELTDDLTVHRYFLEMCTKKAARS